MAKLCDSSLRNCTNRVIACAIWVFLLLRGALRLDGVGRLTKVFPFSQPSLSSKLITLPARFLFKLGLRRYPPLKTVIGLCASGKEELRAHALKFLLDNLSVHYSDYRPSDFATVSYVPAAKDGKECMTTPKEVSLVWCLGRASLTPFNYLGVLKPRMGVDGLLHCVAHLSASRLGDQAEVTKAP